MQGRKMLVAAENEEWDMVVFLEKEREPVFAELIATGNQAVMAASHRARLQELEVLENSILTACIRERQACQTTLTEMNRQAKAADSYRSCDFL